MKVSFMRSAYVSMPAIAVAADILFDLLDTNVNSGTAETTDRGNIRKIEPESRHVVKFVDALEKQKVSLVPLDTNICLVPVHVSFRQNRCAVISSMECANKNSFPLFTAFVHTTKKVASHFRKVCPELQAQKFITCSPLQSFSTRPVAIYKLTENPSADVKKTFADTARPKILKALKENEKAAFSVAA